MCQPHRVDITESSSAQFPTWIFNFGPYGQVKALRENYLIMLKYATFELCFFPWAKMYLVFIFFTLLRPHNMNVKEMKNINYIEVFGAK